VKIPDKSKFFLPTAKKIKNFVSIANSIYQKFEKVRFSNFCIKIFFKKNKNKKTKNTSVLSTENCKSFFLFFYTFSILSIFGALETAWFCALFPRKKSFLG